MQISYNKLKIFGECALKYRFTYIERLPRPPVASLAPQRRLHAALRQYHHFARRDGVVHEEDLLDAYAHTCGADEHPEVRESKEYQEGAVILRRYCQTENRKRSIPVLLEETVKFAYGPYVLTGQIDRIDRIDQTEGAGHSIIDYKLDRTLPAAGAAANSRQLAFYHLLVEEGLGKPVEDVRLYYLRHGVEQKSLRSRKQLRETVEWVDRTAEAIHKEKEWKPIRGTGCQTCAFARVCPARTGQERPQEGVWQQGSLLWDMEEE